jgi:hypothetical protein
MIAPMSNESFAMVNTPQKAKKMGLNKVGQKTGISVVTETFCKNTNPNPKYFSVDNGARPHLKKKIYQE